MKFQKTSGPEAGTEMARSASRIMSGWPSCQPGVKVGGGGISEAGPSGAPSLIQSSTCAICASLSRCSSM